MSKRRNAVDRRRTARFTVAVPWCAAWRFEVYVDWKVWLVGINWGADYFYLHVGPVLAGVCRPRACKLIEPRTAL